MKVILKEYVYMHGVAGDVVNVADGFARNYLIPRGKAVKATPEALRRNEELMQQVAVRRKELTEKLVEVANQIDGVELLFGRKAGRNNKLYGSVTTMDIATALLEKTGVDIDRRRISERPLRELGEFDVTIRMAADLTPVIKVVIVAEDQVEEYLRAKEAPPEEEAPQLSAEDEPVEEQSVEAVAEAAPSADETLVSQSTEVLETPASTEPLPEE